MANPPLNDRASDVLVIGAESGGMSTAFTAAKAGLDVVEKPPVIGGTTTFSGGALWIPGNRRCGEGATRGRRWSTLRTGPETNSTLRPSRPISIRGRRCSTSSSARLK
jgi:glycine/D-amino acid oxidase-like deaminating enzyme